MLSERRGIIFKPALLSCSSQATGWTTISRRAWPVSSRSYANRLDVFLVRAQVASSILQLVQLTNAMYSSWGGDGPYPKRQWDPMREVIHECVEALETSLVDGHLHSPKLRIPTLEEGYFFGRGYLGDSACPSHGGKGLIIVVGAGGGLVVSRHLSHPSCLKVPAREAKLD